MNTKESNLFKRYFSSKFFLFILFTLSFLGITALYYFYNRQRTSTFLYVSVMLTRPQNLSVTAPFNWVPYWLAESIQKGDKDINPLGGVNAEVVEKQAIESSSYGSIVHLLLRVRAIRDRSGVYLFRNKPLAVGSSVDLRLVSTQADGYITYIGTQKPSNNTILLRVGIKARSIESYIADAIKIGNELKDSNGITLAKIIDKKVSPAEVRSDNALGIAQVSYDQTRKDLEVTIELKAERKNNAYYFTQTQKVKVNEWLYIPFPDEAANAPITFVEEIK
jgi:hypothetical protein